MGMRARVLDDVAVPDSGATADTPSGSASSSGIAANAYDALILVLSCTGTIFNFSSFKEEQAMSRKPYSLSKQVVLATALALGASSLALADDSSMSRFGGESYAYFNQPVLRNAAAGPTWRQSHPNGLTESELQALSSSSLAVWQIPSGSGVATNQSNVAQR
jgi:hypothetical protein